MSYKHFTINERNKLEVLLKENYKIVRIAEILEKDRTTIYREIKRVKGEYCAEKAQINANNKGCKKGRNYKITSELKNLIEFKLCERWSPEQIVGRELKGKLSFKTIYNWLYKDFFDVSLDVLRRKGKTAKTKETRGKFNIEKSISERQKKSKKKKFLDIGSWILRSFIKRREQSLFCNIYGVKDEILCSNKNAR
jgi:transposase for insertion sequence element